MFMVVIAGADILIDTMIEDGFTKHRNVQKWNTRERFISSYRRLFIHKYSAKLIVIIPDQVSKQLHTSNRKFGNDNG